MIGDRLITGEDVGDATPTFPHAAPDSRVAGVHQSPRLRPSTDPHRLLPTCPRIRSGRQWTTQRLHSTAQNGVGPGCVFN